MSMTWLSAVDTIRKARNKAYGKPLANNTRLYERGEGDEREFGIVLHGTEVVTIHSNDTYTLRNGGWTSPTTLDRIRRFAPVSWQTLITERGDWFVRLTPNPNDPRPANVERSIPKPFEAVNPGPEPIRGREGCHAGEMATVPHINEIVRIFRKDMQPGDLICEDSEAEGDKYDFINVTRTWISHIYYSEGSHYDEGWANLPDNNSVHSNYFINDDGERVERVQCPHCAKFDEILERWNRAYYGGSRWGRAAIDQAKGYKLYAEMMERFDGDVEAWQAAYIEDFRARRAYLKADREWDQRNRVPFYDGIVIDSEGYAARLRQDGPSPAKLRRHEQKVEKIKKDIDKYIEGYIKALVKGMPMPSSGDCWYCCMFDAVPANDDAQGAFKRGKSIEPGSTAGNDHLFDHFKERYYVPSLAVNALRDRGYKDIGVAIHLAMDPDTNTMGGPRAMTDTVRRDLRRYLRNRMVPAAPTS